MSEGIVVGFTDSEPARRALAWAADRALARRRPLTIVGVLGGAVGTVGEGELVRQGIDQLGELLEQEASALRARGIDARTDARVGNPVHELIDASTSAELLVIGSDVTAGQNRGVHGVRLTAGAHAPVVVVPVLAEAERSGVVVGVDGSDASTAAIAFAAAEADRLREPLVAIATWAVTDVPSSPVLAPGDYRAAKQGQTEEMLAMSMAGVRQDYPDLTLELRTERGNPAQVLRKAGTTARLLVVGSHGRGAMARFLLGSVSHEVLTSPTAVTAVVR